MAKDDFTFERYPEIECEEVRFKNRYGIELAGVIFKPADGAAKHPAVVVSGPFGAVKEQSSGLYAQQLAKMGFLGLAFDNSFCGESGGEVRNTASPEIFTEDFSAAVDYLGLRADVDRDAIGAVGICGLSGMAVTAAAMDVRIKAVATFSMYDMSRDISRGHADYYTEGQRAKIKAYLAERRWKDAEEGAFAPGPHEVGFGEDGEPVTELPSMPEGVSVDDLMAMFDPVTKAFFSYYVLRARHERAVNFVSSWTANTPWPFFQFPLMSNIQELAGRPVMFVAGENAHSRYYSEDAYAAAAEPKELVIVQGADHADLYDQMDKIPFEKLAAFFRDNLK